MGRKLLKSPEKTDPGAKSGALPAVGPPFPIKRQPFENAIGQDLIPGSFGQSQRLLRGGDRFREPTGLGIGRGQGVEDRCVAVLGQPGGFFRPADRLGAIADFFVRMRRQLPGQIVKQGQTFGIGFK